MPLRTRALDEARRTWHRTAPQIGDQLRAGRHVLGTTQRAIGRAIGVGQSEISRREHGQLRSVSTERLALHAAAVGLRLRVNLWPLGGGLRDEAQLRYISALVARIGKRWTVITEATIPISGDLRAVDILLTSGSIRVAIEVITRVTDVQAQLRGIQQKARDIRATRLVIVLAATRTNRSALAASRSALAASFDFDSRRVLAELAAGRDPGRDAIILFDG
jgi:transcriptional regulator with XRE-family HTH domain